MELFDELRELCAVPALGGGEDRLASLLCEKLKDTGAEVCVDYSCNVTASFAGTEGGRSLLFLAHMDEVGLMVRAITPEGFLKFDRIGGPSDKTLRGQMVEVAPLKGDALFDGVVGTKAHHLTPESEKNTVPSRMDMYVDIGAESRADVEALGIGVGSAITYKPRFARLGKSRLSAKCLDNRAAVWALLSTARHLAQHPPKADIHLGFSVQEEFNVRGSLPMVQRLQPDMVISVDCTIACDTPDLAGEYEVRMGAGPTVSRMNSYGKGPIGGLISTPALRDFIENTCEGIGLPFQREVMGSGLLSDASYVQMLGAMGTATAHVGFPIRYAHCPAEVADMNDIQGLSRLLCAVATGIDSTLDLTRPRK